MNKSDLIDAMAENAGISKAAAKKALESFLENVEGSLKKGADEIGEEKLELAKQHGVNIFYPYILLKQEGNLGTPENYKGQTAEIGELTDSLSYDYLRSIIKHIILEITDDGNELKELEELYLKYKLASRNKTEETFQNNLIKLSKAALFNSVKQQGRKLDEVTNNNIKQDLNEEWIKIEEGSLLKILITIFDIPRSKAAWIPYS